MAHDENEREELKAFAHQTMTFNEREQLKEFANQGQNLKEALEMTAHWMRQSGSISFSEYAANWVAARADLRGSAMQKQWPLQGPRKILDEGTDWQW